MRVLILHDQDAPDGDLTAALETDGVDVTVARASLADAIASIDVRSPDVTVVEIHHGDPATVGLIEQLVTVRPGAPVVALIDGEDSAPLDAVAAGAIGIARRTQPSSQLRDVVQRAARGEVLLPLDAVERIVQRLAEAREEPAPDVRLSGREREILSLIASGVARAAIARDLGMSLTTVNTHVKRIRQKLGAHSAVEAASIALRSGMLERPTGDFGRAR